MENMKFNRKTLNDNNRKCKTSTIQSETSYLKPLISRNV